MYGIDNDQEEENSDDDGDDDVVDDTYVAPTRTARAHYSARRPSHARMATKKIAVVTGANKGIGFAVAKHLCVLSWCIASRCARSRASSAAVPDIHVIITARDVAKGQEAVAELTKLGRTVRHQPSPVAPLTDRSGGAGAT